MNVSFSPNLGPAVGTVSYVIPGSGLFVWVKVVSVLDGTSYKWIHHLCFSLGGSTQCVNGSRSLCLD